MGGKTAVAAPPPPPPPLAPRRKPVAVVSPPPRLRPRPPRKKILPRRPRVIRRWSPFLRSAMDQDHPQAAAVQARQQASSYHAPTPADANPTNGTGAVSHTPAGAPAGSEDPYWLPPLIDSADFGPTPVSGSAAFTNPAALTLSPAMRRWLILTGLRPGELSFARADSGHPPALPADSEAQMPDSIKSPDSFRDSIGRVSIRPVPDVEETSRSALSVSSTCANTTTISWPFPICGIGDQWQSPVAVPRARDS